MIETFIYLSVGVIIGVFIVAPIINLLKKVK
jgi:hypothetical protein